MLPRGLLKEHSQVIAFFLRCLDAFAVVVAGLIAYFVRFGHGNLNTHYIVALSASALLTLLVFQFLQVYESMRIQRFWGYIVRITQAVLGLFLVLAGFAFITKTGELYSRQWFLLWSIFGLLLLFFFRCSLLFFLYFMRTRGWNERRVIVIGTGELSRQLVMTMQQALWTGFRVAAVIATPQNIHDYFAQSKESVDEVWLALPIHAEKQVKEILHELRHYTVTVRFILDLFGLDLSNHSITYLAGFPTLNLNASPMVGMNRLMKAIEDRVIAAVIMIAISPLLLLIALGVKLSSRGPVIFKQLRHGWDGRIIKVYKFRTMFQHQESDIIAQARADDHRVTPFGRFLRKTSLDELPQFFNVLQGRMSIVGPRPHAVSHNEYYKDSIKAYMQRHKVKPGITGWAQVNGFRGETDTLEKMRNRVEYDLYYIEHWTLLFDLKIIFLTLFRGFMSKNAY